MITSNRFSRIQEKAEPVILWIMSLLETGHPIANACSMGKDSTVVLVLILEAISRVIKKCGHAPRCYVTHSDTLIENPAMSFYAQSMLDLLETYVHQNRLPVEVVRVTPALSATFAYTTIGRGKLPRFVNSEHRGREKRMDKRGDSNTTLVTQADGTYSNAPIADWEVEDVWELLMSCGVDRGRIYTTFSDDFNLCLKLYRDANEGTCGS